MDNEPKSSRPARQERRRESRDSIKSEVAILCEDETGKDTLIPAQLLDVSEHGVRFRSLRQLPLRSAVTFYHRKIGIGGRGMIRYCNWSNAGYEIGVEFRHGTGWHGPQSGEGLRRLSAALDEAQPVETPEAAIKPR